ncbi:MAG: aldolase, partial [Candidatus Omnitrophota bacterium]
MGRKPMDVEKLVMDLINSDDMAAKRKLAKKITDIAYKNGIYLSSIHEFYMARGKNEFSGFTVPAMNLRSMTYDLARAIFRVAKRNNSGSFIFEIAKSEMGYTAQPPVEYSAVILAAAIKENYQGPVFVQADHVQVNAKKYLENPGKELEGLQTMIADAIASGFYNIDIDSSTVVDLTQKDIKKQQRLNYEICAKLTQFIRRIEP